MTLYDREDRIECDECDTWAEHEWHEKAEDFEGQLLAALSKLGDRDKEIEARKRLTAKMEATEIELRSRLEDRERQLGECTAGYQTLEREVAELRSRLDELQAQYGHTYNGMLTARADRDELQRRLDTATTCMESIAAQIEPWATHCDYRAEPAITAALRIIRAFLSSGVETLTVRVSDEELAELNRNAIARGQAPLTPVVENLPTWCPKCNAVMAHVPHQCGVVEKPSFIAAALGGENQVLKHMTCGAPLRSSRTKNCLLPAGHAGDHQFSTAPE